ncbi:MAG TPA: OmpW family outer membrane protein [Steroidobacteraceae bacterium]|jgi:outer membrane protein
MKAFCKYALLVALTGSGVPLCQAAQSSSDTTPDNEIRVGGYAIFYDATARDISGPFVPAGLNVHVKNVQTLYLAYERTFSRHFGFELAAGWPPATKTYGRGPATVGSVPYNGQEISSARWLAPSALLTYKFLDQRYALRPYVGIGVTYVNFYDRQSTAAGDAVSGGPTKISLTSSIGPTATAGLAYRLSPRLGLYASYSFSRVRTNLTADTAGEIRTTHISFAPGALVISGGFSF